MPSITTRHCIITAYCALSTLSHAAPVNEKAATYITIQVPGAIATYPASVNDSMAVAGSYSVSDTFGRGFVRDAEGNITTFSVRNSPATVPVSINAAGDITGWFATDTGNQGFLRRADGEIVTFAAPLSVSVQNDLAVLPIAINDYGEIAGNIYFPTPGAVGFVRAATGADKILKDGTAIQTVLTGLNASGTTVGYIQVPQGGDINQSFYVTADGFQQSFHVPLEVPANDRMNDEETVAQSIAADGTIAGSYSVGWLCLTCGERSFSRVDGGFIRSPQGVFTQFTTPAQSAAFQVRINGNATVTGCYFDANGALHGFVRDAYGIVTSFDPPRGLGTTPTSINDSGIIAGYYHWNAQGTVGFLRIPKP